MFRKFIDYLINKKKMIDVISVGDIIQFNGGKSYSVKKLEKGKNNCEVYIEPYRGYHPIPFPGDQSYKGKVWESIRHLNYEMEQTIDSIYSVTKTKQSEEPDFYRLSVEEAHKKAIEWDKIRNN